MFTLPLLLSIDIIQDLLKTTKYESMNYTKYIKTSNMVSQAQLFFESIQSGKM